MPLKTTIMGVFYEIGGTQTSTAISVAVLGVAAIVFFGLSLIRVSKKKAN